MHRVRNKRANALLLLGTFFLAFLLAKTAVRLVKPNIVRFRLLHEVDRKLGFRLKSNYTTRYQTADFDTVVKINAAAIAPFLRENGLLERPATRNGRRLGS